MSHRIHVFGASGSGTTTLGRHLAGALNGRHLDTDDYYWIETNPPFTDKRHPKERISLIESHIEGEANWVLSGSICSWGDPLLERFTLAVFLHLNPVRRMQRLKQRETARYGSRIQSGGDMEQQHREFMDWARSYDHALAPIRSLDLHERWMQGLSCPVIRLDAADSVDRLTSAVLKGAPA